MRDCARHQPLATLRPGKLSELRGNASKSLLEGHTLPHPAGPMTSCANFIGLACVGVLYARATGGVVTENRTSDCVSSLKIQACSTLQLVRASLLCAVGVLAGWLFLGFPVPASIRRKPVGSRNCLGRGVGQEELLTKARHWPGPSPDTGINPKTDKICLTAAYLRTQLPVIAG